jgi:hypothetical protein
MTMIQNNCGEMPDLGGSPDQFIGQRGGKG